MNERKIDIIVHATDEQAVARLTNSLNQVRSPRSFSVNVKVIRRKDKYKAYNEAMRASDAKYKIYIDERAVVTKENFVDDLMKVFQNDKTVGAVGTSGAIELSTHGVSLNSAKRAAKNFSCEVEVLDGFFFATQYDLPWRDDLFSDNFFGGEAQCVEFKRAGYKLFVIGDWISIDTASLKLDEPSRQKFLNEYSADLFPLVSVIIPTFNRPKYFREALESVLNQTYRNIEGVISDDSTNDETETLIQDYLARDKRIKYFRNKGFTSHDNWSFLRAYNNPAAEYVNWLMDDDLFYPTKLEKMVEVYRNNPDVSLVTSAKYTVDADGKVTGNNQGMFGRDVKINGDEAGRLLFLQDNYIGEPSTVLIRKKFLRNNDLCWNEDETGFFNIVDVSTWCQLLTQGNMIRLNECLSALRRHEGQSSRWNFTGALWAVSFAKLLKTAIDKKVFFHDEQQLRTAILFILGKSIRALNNAVSKNYHSAEIETTEKTLVALAQSLTNGYKLELPLVEYSEQDKFNKMH